MIFKIPKKRQKAYQFDGWIAVATSKKKAQRDLKRYFGAKKYKKIVKK
jgi:hypothetical protein